MKKIILLFSILFPMMTFSDDGIDIRLEFTAFKCNLADKCTSNNLLPPLNMTHIPYDFCNDYWCSGKKVSTFLYENILFFTKIKVFFHKSDNTYTFSFEFGGNHIKFSSPVINSFSLTKAPINFSYYEMTGDKMNIISEPNYYKSGIIIQGVKVTPPTDPLL